MSRLTRFSRVESELELGTRPSISFGNGRNWSTIDMARWCRWAVANTHFDGITMSQKDLKAFLTEVGKDKSLQEKLEGAKDANAVATIAKAAGWDVTSDELGLLLCRRGWGGRSSGNAGDWLLVRIFAAQQRRRVKERRIGFIISRIKSASVGTGIVLAVITTFGLLFDLLSPFISSFISPLDPLLRFALFGFCLLVLVTAWVWCVGWWDRLRGRGLSSSTAPPCLEHAHEPHSEVHPPPR